MCSWNNPRRETTPKHGENRVIKGLFRQKRVITTAHMRMGSKKRAASAGADAVSPSDSEVPTGL